MSFIRSSRFLMRPLLVAVVPLFLVACGPDDQQRADDAAVGRSGVSPAIYDKMVHDDALSISDVAALSRARVNDGVIIRYIRDHDTVYYIRRPDIEYLQRAGVSQSVIDFMVQTGSGYPYGPGYGPGPGPIIPIGIGIGIGGGGGRWR